MQGGTERVLQVWQQLRQANVPVAAFWLQDWVGQRTTSYWELDRDRYPDWQRLVADLRASDIRVMTYEFPDDPAVYDFSYQEFLVGLELMVIPVLDPGEFQANRAVRPDFRPLGRGRDRLTLHVLRKGMRRIDTKLTPR
jgi:alpha-glucosidase (family GH31 glycosyl hydrolase)